MKSRSIRDDFQDSSDDEDFESDIVLDKKKRIECDEDVEDEHEKYNETIEPVISMAMNQNKTLNFIKY